METSKVVGGNSHLSLRAVLTMPLKLEQLFCAFWDVLKNEASQPVDNPQMEMSYGPLPPSQICAASCRKEELKSYEQHIMSINARLLFYPKVADRVGAF